MPVPGGLAGRATVPAVPRLPHEPALGSRAGALETAADARPPRARVVLPLRGRGAVPARRSKRALCFRLLFFTLSLQ